MEDATGNGVLKKRKNLGSKKDDESCTGETDVGQKESKLAPNSSKVIGIVFASLLLDLLAFTMILPLLPALLEQYAAAAEGAGGEGGAGLYAALLRAVRGFQRLSGAPAGATPVLVGGALGSMFSLLQFLTSPVVGSLSDAYGRKPMLLLCLGGISASHLVWGLARSFGVFVLARALGGLARANVSLAMAVVADVSDDTQRARGMALVGLAFSVGFTLGPLGGAWLARGGAGGAAPAACALALSLANMALVALALPETLPKEKRTPLRLSARKAAALVLPWQLVRFSAAPLGARARARLHALGRVYLLYLFLYSGLEFTLTFLTHTAFHYSAMQQGKMFLVIGVIMAVLQGGAARRLGAAGAARAARGALLLTPLSFLCVSQAARPAPPLLSPLAWLWTGLVLFAICTAFAVSCLSELAARGAGAGARGAVLGALRSLGALARALGPLAAATMYWWGGPVLTYAVGAALLLLPAAMLCRAEL
ncbi:major facilitator superfamily domain-containing protein 10 [Plutella xylostella]|uniref:major facilitator superfamily domain-containing protein 10 n=1 Tax=Plutella xylostella TaxID=51655 RepID=UPI002032D33B|nr:major facilitator superfamily domain-containing protein 10 [Plutella xylostella]